MFCKWNSVALSLLAVFTAAPGGAQARFDDGVGGPDRTWSPVAAATQEVLQGFNEIGSHAGQLRLAMAPIDASAFDGAMFDVMSGLMALPYIRLGGPCHPRICPTEPRPERISQIDPDVRALDRFFARLQGTTSSAADVRLFASARKNVKRMLAALPAILPTVSAKSLAGAPKK